MSEQLAVGEIATGRSAVIWQERRGVAMRADMNRARDQLLARSALAGNEDGEIVPLQALDLFRYTRHRGACRDKAGQERFERAIYRRASGNVRSIAHRAQLETLFRHGDDHPQPAN